MQSECVKLLMRYKSLFYRSSVMTASIYRVGGTHDALEFIFSTDLKTFFHFPRLFESFLNDARELCVQLRMLACLIVLVRECQ